MGSGMVAERSEDLQRSGGHSCLSPLNRSPRWGQDCPLSGQRIYRGQEVTRACLCSTGRPMGSGLPAERSKGSTEVRGSPRGRLCSSWPPRWGQDCPLSGRRVYSCSLGRPWRFALINENPKYILKGCG